MKSWRFAKTWHFAKTWRFVLGFIVLLAFDTFGQVGFKMVAERTHPVLPEIAYLVRLLHEPWVIAVIVAYIGAFIVYMSLMKSAPIGPLFAASHLELVTVAIVGVVVFGESLGPMQIVGCLAILGGIALLARDQTDERH
jgi:multidrug transporter EmrE-like cation transporter